MDIHLTKEQAKSFILRKQGLWGEYRFKGKEGAYSYIAMTRSMQFDPVNLVGRSPELSLHARVEGYVPSMLYELLYEDRKLIDYFDKNLCIVLTEDYPCFKRRRDFAENWYHAKEISSYCDKVIDEITKRGPLNSAELGMNDKADWHWGETRKGRACLEHLYYTGKLCIHHKHGMVKSYDLIERCYPNVAAAEDPQKSDREHYAWRVYRRIGAVGMLWDRPSDAWLGIDGMKSQERQLAFCDLIESGKILPTYVDGLKVPLYIQSDDKGLLNETGESQRTEVLPPLDSMLWDRKLISALFDFQYSWEIYTPQSKRKYGAYVLPVLSGSDIVGRLEAVREGETLRVKNIWYENGKTRPENLDDCLNRLAAFNNCMKVEEQRSV